jgi:hypothetical protein
VVISLAADAAGFLAAAKGKPIDEQIALWDRLIEAPHVALYDQVVWETASHRDAGARKARLLAARLRAEAAIADDLPSAFDRIEWLARREVPRFHERFPDARSDVPIYLALSPTFDAKGAILAEPSPRVVLVFGVDSVVLFHDDLDVVFPHELFHVYHATVSGFLSDGVMPGVDLSTPLWEEGLATYVSSLFQPNASDGQLLMQEALGRVPAGEVPALARAFLRDAGSPAIDPDRPEVFARWFHGSGPSVTPTTPNRAGYLIGLHVARLIARTTPLQQMVHWRPSEAREPVLAALRTLANES